MSWWQWLLAVAAVVAAVMLVVTLPSVVRYWKIRKM